MNLKGGGEVQIIFHSRLNCGEGEGDQTVSVIPVSYIIGYSASKSPENFGEYVEYD